jgi:uncharacterized membrane protein
MTLPATKAARTGAAQATPRSAALPEPAEPRSPDGPTATARNAALATLLALIALGLAWELWLAPTGSGTLALKVVPLVLCLVGLWRHRMYTFRWLSLLVWLYFTEGVVRAVTEAGISRWLAVGEIVLSVALFCISAFYIRWRLRRGRELAAAAAQAGSPAPRA